MAKSEDYFKGKTLFLTGAASGIGQATSYIFAREGANVICADLDGEGAERVAKEVDQRGGKGFAITCDVMSRDQVNQAVNTGIDHFGRIDFQFNNAGSAIRRSKFLDIDDELFEKKRYKWTGSTSLGAYLVSATSSHYDWAFKLIKKCLKKQLAQ